MSFNDIWLKTWGSCDAAITALWAAIGGTVPSTRKINTTAPLTGGGDLSADRTLAIPAATAVADGYMSSTQAALVNGATASDTADRKSTRLNSSHSQQSRMPSSA